MNELDKRDTLSIIAHELRTSLIANRWVLQMFLDGDLGTVTDQQKIFIEKALKNNQKMVDLITELVEAGKNDESTKLTFEPTNIASIGLEVLSDFEADAKKRGIALEYSGPTTGVVMADVNKNKIHSLLQELVNNALKYTEKGHVRLGVSEDGDMVQIVVEDTGIGIPEADKVNIFQKFFRGETAQKREEIGSGLGLFAVQKITEKHGGTVELESQEGKGSTFTVSLPKHHS